MFNTLKVMIPKNDEARDPIKSFKVIIAATGLQPPADLIADGRVHMFSPDGDGTPCDAWYILRREGPRAGAFGCQRKKMTLAWRPGGVKPAAKDQRAAELSNLRARLSAFSGAIVSAGVRQDWEISPRYADFLLRTAERMVELGAQPGLDDPLTAEGRQQ
ncbi:hypothetical protein LJR175_000988 [Variovorax sp. LjRoot175]|uniref:hypothetical protein n=1 Tax=Variovorax sp. LjRoot175 TaxID=3342276 RepID=UPI003ECE8571